MDYSWIKLKNAVAAAADQLLMHNIFSLKLLYFGIPREQEGSAIVHFLHSSFSLFLEVRVFLAVCFNFWLKQYI
jgi:hypothetical protein